MPFINVKTNVEVPESKRINIKSALGQAIEILPGKSEIWLMVNIEPECMLWFQGEDLPASMVEVSLLGGVPANVYDKFTEQLCHIIETELSIPRGRIYVKFIETEHWGWKGSML